MKATYSTDREIKALRPTDRWYDVKDAKARNLIVRVGPQNAKGEFRRTFCLVTRFPGSKNPTRHAFGEYGSDLTLEEARAKADEWRALIRKNIDPRQLERQEKESIANKRDLSFGAVMEDYIARQLKTQRRGAQAEREIRTEILPAWKDKLVSEVTRADVVTLVEAIADRPAPYHAHNVFGHIRTFYNWAIERGKYDLEASPCDRLKPARIIGNKKPRQRVLSDDELRAFWRASGRLGYPYGPLFRLLLLTGQRKSEVAEARWREFHPDLVNLLRDRERPIDWSKVPAPLKIWTVPAERFKSDSTHLVPLTDDALRILEAVPHFVGKRAGDHLFSTTSGVKAVNGFSKAKERLDREMLRTLKAMARQRGQDPDSVELAAFVIHDIRRTVRTRLSSLKASEQVAEMIIGHGKKGLARVYDQHQFVDEMREALEAWAGRLRSIVNPPPANVVPIRRESR
jgi:integrase